MQTKILTDEEYRLLQYLKKLKITMFSGFIVMEVAMGDIVQARPLKIKPGIDFEGSMN